MNASLAAAVLGGLAALAGCTVAVADGAQSIQATIQAVGDVTVDLRLADTALAVGDDSSVVATVTNSSGKELRSARVILHVDESGLATPGGPMRVPGAFPAGMTRTVSWAICGRAPGNYLLVAAVDAVETGGRTTLAESSAQLLTVRAGAQKCRGPGN